jgi:hypothetical protein
MAAALGGHVFLNSPCRPKAAGMAPGLHHKSAVTGADMKVAWRRAADQPFQITAIHAKRRPHSCALRAGLTTSSAAAALSDSNSRSSL